MTEVSATDPLLNIRATLRSIESRLQRGDVPPDGLADLKSAIDDACLRGWAACVEPVMSWETGIARPRQRGRVLEGWCGPEGARVPAG
ncbi:MAG: hypothetical protein ABIQ49_08260 [Gemmatimonadales bacterium]